MNQHVNLDIMTFVEQNILPRYNAFGPSHNLTHATRVIANAVDLARRIGADIDMAYVAAAYHDLGMSGPKAIHHLTSGKILAGDARLRKWFTPAQIQIMREAVEDHRASASHTPRNIYGKIVAEADRDLDPETVFRRAIEYSMEKHPDYTEEQTWDEFRKHMGEKYSSRGYMKLWIPNSKNEEGLKEIRRVIDNEPELHQTFLRLYEKEKNGTENESSK